MCVAFISISFDVFCKKVERKNGEERTEAVEFSDSFIRSKGYQNVKIFQP